MLPAVVPPVVVPVTVDALCKSMLALIKIDDKTKPLVRNTPIGDILQFGGFCDKADFPHEQANVPYQYCAYLLGMVGIKLPNPALMNLINPLQRFLLITPNFQELQQFKRELDSLYQAITGLVPFPQLTPANKIKKFEIDEHQDAHYKGGIKNKNHFCFEWADVHKLTVKCAFQALIDLSQTDGDFIFYITENGKAKVLAVETTKCRAGYCKVQMGTRHGFSGHSYPLDNEAADREHASAITVNWADVIMVVLSPANNIRRESK